MGRRGLRALATGAAVAAALGGAVAGAPSAGADGPLTITSGSCNSSTYAVYCTVRFAGGYPPVTGAITATTNTSAYIQVTSTPGLAIVTGNCVPGAFYRIDYRLTDSVGQTAPGVLANRCTI